MPCTGKNGCAGPWPRAAPAATRGAAVIRRECSSIDRVARPEPQAMGVVFPSRVYHALRRGLRGVPPAIALVSIFFNQLASICAQVIPEHVGEVVPRDIREMYDRGLQYLVKTQSEAGDWRGGQTGPGTTGLALMAFLASGEDPNFGIYSNPVKKAVRNIIRAQDARTGYFGNSMYHHGFAMLGLAEAYGSVDERNLWPAGEQGGRSIGAALELGVRAAVTSQKKNSFGGWRYSPDSTDADTSVSGAVLV